MNTNHSGITNQELSPLKLPKGQVAILGLGRVGRQLALQLTALGVQRLYLVDPGAIKEKSHLAEGYNHEDIGRLKIHAVAQACHQLNPVLDIHTGEDRSLDDIRRSSAIFSCPSRRKDWGALGKEIYQEVDFIAEYTLTNRVVHLLFKRCLGAERQHQGPVCRYTAVYASDLAATLLIGEFIRYCRGAFTGRTIKFDIGDLGVNIED